MNRTRSYLGGTLVVLLIGSLACQTNKQGQTSSDNAGTSSPDTAATTEQTSSTSPGKDTATTLAITEPANDSLWALIEKTPCFGRCPIYKARIYQAGTVILHAQKFTEHHKLPAQGWYRSHLRGQMLQAIRDSARSIHYFSLREDYNNPNVSDLPSTITGLYWGDSTHRVRNRYGGPEKLSDFEDYLHGLLQSLHWEAVQIQPDSQH